MAGPRKNWLVWALAIAALATPVALVQYGRHQGWQQHQSCLQEALSREIGRAHV